MCTINISTIGADRQVFWQINYLYSSKVDILLTVELKY